MGCGIAVAEVAVKFCLQYTNKIIDPFCGRGTIPFVAENQGAEVIGIDIDEECAEASSTASPIEREFSFND
jgi:tRNA G10  N-methylase Trm11